MNISTDRDVMLQVLTDMSKPLQLITIIGSAGQGTTPTVGICEHGRQS